MKSKFLWFSDLHLDNVSPWTLIKFIFHIKKENPKGLIITGDISNGLLIITHLRILATLIKCPIYFVLGNHDYYFSSIDEIHNKIRKLCNKYTNLIWMRDNNLIHINDDVAFIGHEGWYDAYNGKPEYLKFTVDWFLIKDFRDLDSMKSRIDAWRDLSAQSAKDLVSKLENAFAKNYKKVYILTHFPSWAEATRDVGTLLEKFWLPYNTNVQLGAALENIMNNYKDRYITVLCGHIHCDTFIHISNNIECKVIKAKYYDELRNEEHIYI